MGIYLTQQIPENAKTSRKAEQVEDMQSRRKPEIPSKSSFFSSNTTNPGSYESGFVVSPIVFDLVRLSENPRDGKQGIIEISNYRR
jgi:hypothetical protein